MWSLLDKGALLAVATHTDHAQIRVYYRANPSGFSADDANNGDGAGFNLLYVVDSPDNISFGLLSLHRDGKYISAVSTVHISPLSL